MADSREIIGWFFKNGRRIPIRAKKSPDDSKKPLQLENAEAFKAAGFDIASPEETAKAFGRDVKTPEGNIVKAPVPGREDIKQRALERKVAKTDRNEVLFINSRTDPVRKHAEIVPKLPDKTGKFNLGYAKMGDYQTESGTYTVHSDRDRFDQFGYYAVPKIGRSNVKRDPVQIRKAIKQPGQQAIRRVMKERGLNRQEAIKYLMEQRKK